uniref:Unannotated protein n=1 Tax=freshwater metagenome TaxID=449393 RepID=A0A6J7Q6X9_9ZZZZ
MGPHRCSVPVNPHHVAVGGAGIAFASEAHESLGATGHIDRERRCDHEPGCIVVRVRAVLAGPVHGALAADTPDERVSPAVARPGERAVGPTGQVHIALARHADPSRCVVRCAPELLPPPQSPTAAEAGEYGVRSTRVSTLEQSAHRTNHVDLAESGHGDPRRLVVAAGAELARPDSVSRTVDAADEDIGPALVGISGNGTERAVGGPGEVDGLVIRDGHRLDGVEACPPHAGEETARIGRCSSAGRCNQCDVGQCEDGSATERGTEPSRRFCHSSLRTFRSQGCPAAPTLSHPGHDCRPPPRLDQRDGW